MKFESKTTRVTRSLPTFLFFFGFGLLLCGLAFYLGYVKHPGWAIVAGIIGLIIYLIVRSPIPTEQSEHPPEVVPTQTEPKIPQERATKYCAMCGEKIPVNAEFCSYCGNKVSE